MYTLGIDIGTTNIKSVLFKERATPIAQAVREFKTNIPRPSWAQQRADDWWDAVVDTIRGVLNESRIDAGEVCALAVSCQAPTMLPVDESGEPLYDALIWMDRRSTSQCEMLSDKVGDQRIFEITGNRVDPFYVLGKLIWFRQNHPSLSRKIYKLLSPNSYINLKLTGEYTLDPVHASLTQAYDVRSHRWSDELLNAAGVESSLFPVITDGHAPIGQVSVSAAALTGLKAGTIVLTGTVDGAAAALEAGVVGNGAAVEMTGTSSVLLMSSTRPMPSLNLTYMYSAVPGQHLTLGPMSSTGSALKWFRDTLYEKKDTDIYACMNTEVAQSADDPTGIIFLPYLSGERAPIWDSDARGTFVGLTLLTNRAQVIRSIMEGAAFALRDNVEEAIHAGNSFDQIRSVGGQTNSDIWLKIKASVLNREIMVVDASLGAPGGLAYLLGSYIGEFRSIEEASCQCLRIKKTVKPVKEWVERYDELFGLYKNIYSHLKNDFAVLAKIVQPSERDISIKR
ncbi:MAG: FGGY-family carbohydrate kinase [Rectinemataceae bacterium]|jgi:xylulokinase